MATGSNPGTERPDRRSSRYDYWGRFVSWLDGFEPYAPHRQRFTEYFGNSAGTDFRNRQLVLYNAASNRRKFNAGYRLGINVYQNCDHGCLYCYVNGYSGGIGRGKVRSGYLKRLHADLNDFETLGMPAADVHISNSTDPLQLRLEETSRHTFHTLRLLSQKAHLFSSVILLTKNPALLFAEFDCRPDGGRTSGYGYIESLLAMKEKVVVEVSVALLDNSHAIEPGAPDPESRLDAVRALIDEFGFKVRLRLDPVFPAESGIQRREDIQRILDRASGAQFVISKPLRLVKKSKDSFLEQMMLYYSGGKKKGVEWHSTRWVYSRERKAKEMAFLRDECEKRGMLLVDCMSTVLVDDSGEPVLKKVLETGESEFKV